MSPKNFNKNILSVDNSIAMKIFQGINHLDQVALNFKLSQALSSFSEIIKALNKTFDFQGDAQTRSSYLVCAEF